MPQNATVRRMLVEGYAVPPLFTPDLLAAACHHTLPKRWLLVSGEGTGSDWHVDPLNASAWNTVLSGQKRWALLPPAADGPPGATGFEPVDSRYDYFAARNKGGWWGITQPYEKAPSSGSSLRGYFELLDDPGGAAGAAGVLQCMLGPGETIFVPSGWWHAVLNLQPAVAYTQTYTGSANAAEGGAELGKRPADSKPAECLGDMRVAYPWMFEISISALALPAGTPGGGGASPRGALRAGDAHSEGSGRAGVGGSTPARSDGLSAVASGGGGDGLVAAGGDGSGLAGVLTEPWAGAEPVKPIALWGRPPRDRWLDRAMLENHVLDRSQPLLLEGSPIERWPLVEKWTPGHLWELWDANQMPSLRRVRAQSRARTEFVGWVDNGWISMPFRCRRTTNARSDAKFPPPSFRYTSGTALEQLIPAPETLGDSRRPGPVDTVFVPFHNAPVRTALPLLAICSASPAAF